MNVKTIGREASCDFVIEHNSASRQHASIELSEDGSVWLTDADSRNGMFLNRNDAWVRVSRVTLCVGDRIRFGDHETPLNQLTALLGKRAKVKLGKQHFSLRQGERTNKRKGGWDDPGPALQKPQRNPLTGQIEEDHL